MKERLINQFGKGWYNLLHEYLESEEFVNLGRFLNKRRKMFNVEVYPNKENIFRAFKLCSIGKLKVVIIGQDPYPTRGNANGLAFAYVGDGNIPKSLQNIYKEFENDVKNGLDLDFDYTLESWAKQGILLINTALTVEKDNAGSHMELWNNFTVYLLKQLAKNHVGIVYVCWGKHAQKYIPIIDKYQTNLIIKSVHPSPLSAHKGFFDSKPFSKINMCLTEIAKGYEIEPEKYIIEW